MKNPYEVLRMKEQEIERVRKEMEALRMVAQMLGAEEPAPANGNGQAKARAFVEMP